MMFCAFPLLSFVAEQQIEVNTKDMIELFCGEKSLWGCLDI